VSETKEGATTQGDRDAATQASRRSFARGAVAALTGASIASLVPSTVASQATTVAPLVGLIKPGGLLIVDTIVELEALKVGNQRRAALVLGHGSLNDGGGGLFFWDPTSSAPADGGTVFISSQSATGRWIRLVT